MILNKLSLLFVAFLPCLISFAQEKTLSLPNGWTITVPENFSYQLIPGVDSEPGIIYSRDSSLILEFDSGIDRQIWPKPNYNCSLKSLTIQAKHEIKQKDFRSVYKIPSINKAYIDTINGRIAIIISPKKVGSGLTEILFEDCQSHSWISISGKNLNKNEEELMLNMFKTIKH